MSGHRSPKRHEFTWNPIWGNTGRDPFNQHSNRSDREKWSTSKGGPVFPKLFWLDQTDLLSFGPKFPEILVEWIARSCKQYHHRYQYQSDSVTSLYQLGCHWGKWLQKTLITPWTCNSQVHESAKQTPTFDLLACESIRFFRFRRWPEIRLRGLQAIDLHDIPCIWQTYDANVLHVFPWWLLVWKNQSILTTVKPVLSGHPQGMLKCPLNPGCPPSTGFDI